MGNVIALVQNEMIKMIRRRRFLVIVLMLIVIASLFTYAQYREIQEQFERMGTADWRAELQQKMIDTQNRLSSARLPEQHETRLKLSLQQQQYYLDHDVDPRAPGAPTFIRVFMQEGISLVVPLFVVVLMADIVSGEYSDGTVKALLTRPVKRWKILASKYVTVVLYTSLLVVAIGVICYAVSGAVLGYGGWNEPVLTGFQPSGEDMNTENVYAVPLWQYNLMIYGLGWFVAVVTGTIAFMLSVLVRSTAIGIGVMLALLISGTLLSSVASSWDSAKYLVMVNFRLTDYLTGHPPPVPGMTLPFSLTVLGVWAIAALIVSFVVLTRKDVLS